MSDIPLGSIARSGMARHSVWIKTGADNGSDGWVWIDKNTGKTSEAASGDAGMLDDGWIWITDPDGIIIKRRRITFG